nr:PREDICTED: transcription factor jun-D [Anolis carolinensis]|eukprot:XP_003230150.1 PREDICTED: transcription factor jun-D [Anolis carolinensis]
MEIPFYHDEGQADKAENNHHNNHHNPRGLPLALPSTSREAEAAELGLLKLASPELERLIIQSNGLVTTTPTGGAGGSGSGPVFPFPKASEEQEFAAGFVKALEHLHHQGDEQQQQQQHPGTPAASSLVYATLSPFGAFEGPPLPALLKDEPQTVPEAPSSASPPLSPIDMDSQERIKAERKRLRNRIAASKCRRRKLERISRLEEKVKSLKSQNTELASTASLLRQQVAQLKQKVLSHVNSGCQLLPRQQAAPPAHPVAAY